MTTEEILQYVMKTPCNTNYAVLKSKLNNFTPAPKILDLALDDVGNLFGSGFEVGTGVIIYDGEDIVGKDVADEDTGEIFIDLSEVIEEGHGVLMAYSVGYEPLEIEF